jgi:hypothetical protein
MPPGRTIKFDEPFFGYPTTDVKVKLPLDEIGTLSYDLTFDVIVSSKELSPYIVRIQVGVVSATDFSTLAKACQNGIVDEKPARKRFILKRRPPRDPQSILLILPAFTVSKSASHSQASESKELLLLTVHETKAVVYYPTAGFYVQDGEAPSWHRSRFLVLGMGWHRPRPRFPEGTWAAILL